MDHRPLQDRSDSTEGPWRHLQAVEFATLTRVDWFNTRRLLEPIGYVPTAEYETDYYQQLNGRAAIDDGDDQGIFQSGRTDDRHAGASCEIELAPTAGQSSPSVLGSQRRGGARRHAAARSYWKTYDAALITMSASRRYLHPVA
jgi:hypothetical protein